MAMVKIKRPPGYKRPRVVLTPEEKAAKEAAYQREYQKKYRQTKKLLTPEEQIAKREKAKEYRQKSKKKPPTPYEIAAKELLKEQKKAIAHEKRKTYQREYKRSIRNNGDELSKDRFEAYEEILEKFDRNALPPVTNYELIDMRLVKKR